jgi:Domain of unknown function (DUF3291)
MHLALWWVDAGHIPGIDEAKLKLELLRQHGPTAEAFTFTQPYPAQVLDAESRWRYERGGP